MSISTYAELQTAVANWLSRDDLTSRIPEFIALAEARMGRELETRSQEKRATASTAADDEYIALPTDLRDIRSVRIQTDPVRVLRYMTPTLLAETYPDSAGGNPQAYSIIGAEMALRPIPDGVYTVEMIYSEGISALSDSNTSNTILTRHPDAYLHGALNHGYQYLMDEARAAAHDSIFSRAIAEIRMDQERSRYGAGKLTARTQWAR